MFVGQSLFSPEVVGWAGHSVDGGHFSVEELLRETNVPWKDLVKRVEYGPDVIQGEDIKWPLIPMYQGCVTFDPNQYFRYDHFSGSELFLKFATDMEYDISVYIEDAARPTSRLIKSKAKAQKGADIRFDYVKGFQEVKKYLISYKLTSEGSPYKCGGSKNTSWSGMGDRQYVDHEDCERRRIRDRLDEIGLKDVTPFWAVEEDNLAYVTQSSKIDKKHILDLWNIFDGSWESGCLPGCVTTTTKVTRLAEFRTMGKYQHSALIFTFDKDVKYDNFVN